MGNKSSHSKYYVLTANDLRSGAIVYRGQGEWTQCYPDAQLFSVEQTDSALALAAEQEAACSVIGGYLVEVRQHNRVAWPVKLRESLRLGSQQDYARAAMNGSA